MSDGFINYESIITHRLNLNEFEKGLELMKNKQCLKVLIYPGEKK
jgi:threonine 3-dehydrogenase